ncbi:MAG: MFS transporter [Coriobacteriaceae bacterium]
MAKSKTTHPEGGVEKFLVLPIIVLILAQMGTSGDNGALGLANQQLVDVLGATTPDIQLANMVYSLMAGAFMVAGGLVGTIIGWRTNFRLGAALCAAGELVMALSPNMTIFIWGGRILVGFGASFMIPSVLGLSPFIYHGKTRVLAFGCIGAASGLSAFLPLFLGIVMQFGGFRITFGALAVYFALVLLLSFKLPAIEKPAEKLKFDGLGTGIAATGLFLFLVGLSRISAWGLIEPFAECPFTIFGISPALPMAVLGLILLVILVPVEKRVEQKNGIALLPQSFLKTPQVRAGLVASAITFFFMGVQAILLSPYLQLVAGWSPVLMGGMALAVGIPTFIFSLGIPKFAQRQPAPRHPGRLHRDGQRSSMAFSLHGSEVNGLVGGPARRRRRRYRFRPGQQHRGPGRKQRDVAVRRHPDHHAQRGPGHRRGRHRRGPAVRHHRQHRQRHGRQPRHHPRGSHRRGRAQHLAHGRRAVRADHRRHPHDRRAAHRARAVELRRPHRVHHHLVRGVRRADPARPVHDPLDHHLQEGRGRQGGDHRGRDGRRDALRAGRRPRDVTRACLKGNS